MGAGSKCNENVFSFEKVGFAESYFDTANELLAESEAVLAKGQKDNQNEDSFGLVTVIYSVILFLLGIAGTYKGEKDKITVVGIAAAVF